jgi:outer membrane protein assembly factor BamE (lipoprotein component of BamABCDE complex)
MVVCPLARSVMLLHIGSDYRDNGQMRHIPIPSLPIPGRSGFKRNAAAIVFVGLLAGCSPTLTNHGNIPEPELIESIRIGSSNREQIVAMLGNPSAVATFDQESWYYVGSRTSQIAFLEPEILRICGRGQCRRSLTGQMQADTMLVILIIGFTAGPAVSL